MGKVVFLRRTAKEIDVFGGDVYFDIDGKNAGKLGTENKTVELSPGIHKIKMYKSHLYDTFIGFAEETITIDENEKLMVKYSAPMMVNQAGNMVISQYDSEKEKIILAEKEDSIHRDFIKEEEHKKEQNEKYTNGVKTIIIISIIIGVIFAIYEFVLLDFII